MSKKEEAAPEAVETEAIDYTEDGVGIDDADEVFRRLAEVEPEKDNAEEEAETPEESSEEEAEAEPEEESEEEEAEEPEQKEEEPPQEPSELERLKDEAETWKNRYSDSQREFQTKLKPELDNLKAQNEALAKERQEIAEVLKSDPELLEAFVRAANNPELAKAEPPKAKLDKEELIELFKETFGPESVEALQEAKNTRVQKRMDAIDKFEAEHPGLTDEQRVKLAQMAGTIETIEKIDLGAALDRAYIALYPDKAFEKKSKEIEEAAKVNVIKNKSATITKTTGGPSTKSQPGLTPQEQIAARKMGMSAEDYLKYKNND